jgi:hypothetical protein
VEGRGGDRGRCCSEGVLEAGVAQAVAEGVECCPGVESVGASGVV